MRRTWAWLLLTCGLCAADCEVSLRLGSELVGQGRYAGALAPLREAVLSCGRADSAMPEALKLLGRANQQLGRYAEAERYYKRAIAFFKAADPPDARTLVLWSNLLSLYVEQNRLGAAQRIVERISSLKAGQLGADPEDLRLLYTNLGAYYLRRDHNAEAESMLLRAFDVSGATSAEQQAAILNNFAALAFAAGRSAAAVNYLERALGVLEPSVGPQHPRLAMVLANLGLAYDRAGRAAEADAAFARAYSVAQSSLPEFHPLWAEILSEHAEVLRNRGREEEAKRLERRAQAIRDQAQAEDATRHAVDINELKRRR